MQPLRDAWARLLSGAWPAAQCGLAAFVAWEISTEVLGHVRPYFAAVAAVVSLGLQAGSRLRRTAELAVGVSAGVLIGDLLVQVIGQGAWQVGVVVTVALLIAVALGGTGLAVTQAGLQAVFVVALPRTPHSGLHRWEDALLGGAVALLVAALLPPDPWKDVLRHRTSYLVELAATLRDTAEAVRAGSSTAAAEALARGRLLEPVLSRWESALAVGQETARISPLRRKGREVGDRRLVLALTRATRNLRVLVRRVTVALETNDPLPPALPELLEELARQLDPSTSAEDALDPLITLAARLDPAALGATSLSGQVVVAQLRVSLVDLLEGLGFDHDRAREALPTLRA
ncbi:MAG: aromatic acid exporter family protein [Mycobacteriales bacterium]